MAEPTLRQLRYLNALAETLHFGDAAAACGVSQPALSAQIQELERILGQRLVERTSRKVLLTAEGSRAVDRIRRVLREYDELLALPNGAEPMTGRVRLGVIPTIAPYVLPRLLPKVRSIYPHLDLLLSEEVTPRLIPQLADGGVDLVLAAIPIEGQSIVTTALADECFMLVTPKGHPLATKAAVEATDIAAEELLLLQDGHCLRAQALEFCQLDSLGHRAAVEGTSLTTLVQMVAGGLGVTLLPSSAAADAAANDELCVRPFSGSPPGRTLGLGWRASTNRTETFETLADLFRSELHVLLREAHS